MTKGNYSINSLGRMSMIDFWSMLYLLIVYFFTLVFDQVNIIVFAIYFICAIPFIHYLDKFACLCFLLSTMSYFFLGADEGVWSLYSILAILMMLKALTNKNVSLTLRSCLYFAWMFLAVILSYTHSNFGYKMGLFAMIYNIVISILIAMTVKINKDTLVSYLPKITAFQLVAYIVMVFIKGHYDGYGFSISERVNHNTFGASVSILSVIILVKIVFFTENSLIYKFFWCVSFVLTVVAGSRNALLAMVLTSIIVYVVSKKQQGKVISGWIKVLIVACAILFLGGLLLPEFGVDLSRYNYIELINSGGSNRSIIWETLLPVIWEDYRWFGYGPSHFCSEQMINSLMNLKYKHTHNTIFEAWGELGVFGLLPFLLILMQSYKKSHFYIKNRSKELMFGFVFIEFILLGLGESFFANIEIWIIIGFLLGNKNVLNDRELMNL